MKVFCLVTILSQLLKHLQSTFKTNPYSDVKMRRRISSHAVLIYKFLVISEFNKH